MSAITESANYFRNTVVTSITQGQEIALKGVDTWAKFAAATLPQPVAGQIPLGAFAPESRELINVSFDFASELLAAQKEFAGKFLDTILSANQ